MKILNASYDPTMISIWLALVCLGFVMVASASIPLDAGSGMPYHYVLRHSAYILGGFALVVFFALLPLHIVDWLHKPALLALVVLCVLVLVPGIGVMANGSRRWIDFGFGSVQVSEVAKVLFVVYMAGYFARYQGQITNKYSALLRPVAVTVVVCGLILKEPDFGTVVILACVVSGLLFLSGAHLRHFFLVAVVGLLLLAVLSTLQAYRVERMISFLDPWTYARGSGYQLTQALIAFGRGDVTGLGLGEGVQKLFYLPEAHNDFIFAVIAEELGLIGCLAVIFLLMLLTLRIFRTGRLAMQEDRFFAAYLCYGAGIVIGIQSLINIGVNTGMLPTKGLTLPFISYGGNSLLVCCVLLGFAIRASVEQSRE